MAIAFGTIGAKAIVGTTTQDVAYPASVGAGDLLLTCRSIWLGTATADNETGWTPAGELSGGTGTGVDDHSTVIRADWMEAAGGETGTVTFDQPGATGIISAMARYTKGGGTTWDVAFEAADDAGHGADRSVTLATGLTVAVGDVVVVTAAADTNNTVNPGSPTLSGTATFGTITRRSSGTGTSTGNDGNIEIFDAEVTGAGTCTGFSYTTAVVQCGPVNFIRLREVAVGGTTPVSTTRSTTWDVLAQVSSARVASWDTRAEVNASRVASYDVLASVSASRVASWDVLATVSASRVASWDTLATVSAARSTTWNVESALTAVSTTRATTWRVLAQVADTREATWDTRAVVESDRDTTWDVLGITTTTRAATWDVLATATSTRATTWRTLAVVTGSRTTTWDVASDLVVATPNLSALDAPPTHTVTDAPPRHAVATSPPALTVRNTT